MKRLLAILAILGGGLCAELSKPLAQCNLISSSRSWSKRREL
ncbi:hypothetical protein [Janthinobacterium agaricidamnosum]|uniref:Uncharacterized protein n=1 Tax=Janthinobacterium agaricidamnosum NBRC 102515 = DSM 9628 TaxID=1349767 RepID=W0VDH4_9BURK|nr:hypothetical protein [Janthinobacterium agaricidamnosum]CDG85951.1 hypothetical protein GJA_5355 [Janthinobacterium agaricidamnosum NBRC 102515 = DSM 9628]